MCYSIVYYIIILHRRSRGTWASPCPCWRLLIITIVMITILKLLIINIIIIAIDKHEAAATARDSPGAAASGEALSPQYYLVI